MDLITIIHHLTLSQDVFLGFVPIVALLLKIVIKPSRVEVELILKSSVYLFFMFLKKIEAMNAKDPHFSMHSEKVREEVTNLMSKLTGHRTPQG